MEQSQRRLSTYTDFFQHRNSAIIAWALLSIMTLIIAIISAGFLISLGMELKAYDKISAHGLQRDIKIALLVYCGVLLIICICDLIFSLILYIGIQTLRLSYCMSWRGATVTSLIAGGLLTIAFYTMVHDPIILLGYVPSLIAKPICLWFVNRFIHELVGIRPLPGYGLQRKPTFSLDDKEQIKRSTTIFDMSKGKEYGTSYVVTAKDKPRPE